MLRRGPSAWARLSLWRTDNDEIEQGQWFAGRVYERRCDISPDGSLLAYLAMKPGGGEDIAADSWIAISRPPWFTSLALWAVGGTYAAGALFLDAGRLMISMSGKPDLGSLPPRLRLAPAAEAPYIDETPDWTDRTVHFNRLLRDGWTPAPSIDVPQPVWEKREPGGGRTLVRAPVREAWFDTYGGRSVDEYAVLEDGELRSLGVATWADWDQRGRLIVAQDGRLLECEGDDGTREIADFNDQSPDSQPSPEWARSWPQRR